MPPRRHPSSVLVVLAVLAVLAVPPAAAQPDPAAELEAFLRVPAVAGREEPAQDFVRQRLPGLPVEQDAAGNLVLALGSGTPRRLVVCPLGEPGLLVSRITPDGYLRVVPSSEDYPALWMQSFEGNTVVVGGARGWLPGGVVQRSVHLIQGAQPPSDRPPFGFEDAWIDVGAESAAEVKAMGIRLLDPVALIRRPVRLAGDRLAGPSARLKGACTAAVDAARALAASPPPGTTVFAWTAGDFLNGMGVVHLARSRGPFDEVLRASTGLDSGAAAPWGSARVTDLDLPTLYPGTPVETVSLSDVTHLTGQILTALGRPEARRSPGPALPPPPAIVETTEGHTESAPLLAALIGRYGVSGAEGPVREEVLRHLPAWAKPEVDAAGNVIVTIGQGKEHVLFVAHLDEVGFRVAEVLADGHLRLENRGGVLRTAWEGQAALVHGDHGDRGPVPAVFEPRADWRTGTHAALEGPLIAWTGATSAADLAALGIHAGSTVTMPKRMFRLGPHRALARGFDDRAGSTALLLALARLDPAKLTRRVTFAWDVEEEIGLNGATALAARLGDLTEVHPIDTFVSSDSPRESDRFALAPLGRGPVLRAMDNATLAPRATIERFRALADRAGIPVQIGFTGGATDGVPFLAAGVTMLPFSWPCRSSHSPVEVADLRDVENLARLIVATVDEKR